MSGNTHHSRYAKSTADRAISDTPNPILSRMMDEGMHGRMIKFRTGSAIMIVTMFHRENTSDKRR